MRHRLQAAGALAAALGLGLGVPGAPARGEPLAVNNAGFEELYLGSNLPPEYGGDPPTGSFPTGPPPAGWTAWYENGSAQAGMFIGVLDPGTTADHAPNPPCFPDGAPEADQMVLLYMDGDVGGDEYGVEQELGVGLAPDTVYTLRVAVGDIASCAGLVAPYQSFFDLQGFPGYRVQLLAGGALLAEETNELVLADGEVGTARVGFTTGASPPAGLLSIRLVNRNEPDVGGVDGLEVDFDHVRLDAVPVGFIPWPAWAGWALFVALAGAGAARLRERG